MAKFLSLAEVAQQLGLKPDEVNELRQQGQLNGYRDGASWKFRTEDVQKAADRRAQAAAASDEDSDESNEISLDDISLDDISLEDIQSIGETPVAKPVDDIDIGLSTDDIVLLSEFELGESGPSASQTVIGHPGLPLSPQESDIQLKSLFDDSDPGASTTQLGIPGAPRDPGASAIKLDAGLFDDEASTSKTVIGAPGAPRDPGASAIKLDAALFDDEESTSKTTIGRPGQGLSPDESAIQLRADDFDIASPSSTVIGRPGAENAGPSHVELHEPEEEDSIFNLDLGDDAPVAKAPPAPPLGGSAIRLDAPPEPDPVLDSGITLADDNSDDEFVLGGPGSDITISPADSGISLVDPSDSGLSLDAPLELSSGSAVGESSFELTGSGEDLGSAADFDSDEVMDLKTGDEFLLTPSTAEGEDSSEDSGSQVIAIDAEGAFEDSDSGMFSSMGDSSQSALLEEDVSTSAGPLGGSTMGAATPALAGHVAAGGMIAAETPYPVWVVVMMFFCVLFMALCGMMLYDLMRNMWSWNAPYSVNSSIMDLIMGLFGS